MGDTMKNVVSLAAICLIVLVNCAKRPDQIAPSMVPASNYMAYDCVAIHNEAVQVTDVLNNMSGAQNKQATADAWLTGAGIVLFWPALFFTSGTLGPDDHSTEISTLKGQAEALRIAYQSHGCDRVPASPAGQAPGATLAAAASPTAVPASAVVPAADVAPMSVTTATPAGAGVVATPAAGNALGPVPTQTQRLPGHRLVGRDCPGFGGRALYGADYGAFPAGCASITPL